MDNNNKIKHLEFIQANIARMNKCSFQMKGWSLTITSALLALYASSINRCSSGNVIYIFVAIIPTLLFWILDSYYLQQERRFVGIYNDVAGLTKKEKRVEVKEFEMPIEDYHGGRYNFFKVLISPTELLLYLTIIVGLFVAGIVLK